MLCVQKVLASISGSLKKPSPKQWKVVASLQRQYGPSTQYEEGALYEYRNSRGLSRGIKCNSEDTTLYPVALRKV